MKVFLAVIGSLAFSAVGFAAEPCQISVQGLSEGTRALDWISTQQADAPFTLEVTVIENYTGQDCTGGGCHPVEGSQSSSTVNVQLKSASGWYAGRISFQTGPHGVTPASTIYSPNNLKIMKKMTRTLRISEYEQLKSQLDSSQDQQIPEQSSGERALSAIGQCSNYL